MSIDSGTTIIDELVARVVKDEPLRKKKANTIVTTIGSVITVLLTLATYWLQADTSAPSWLPPIVLILGAIGTVFGVSKTKNGVTDSVAEALRGGLASLIDDHHDVSDETPKANGVVVKSDMAPETLREQAENLLNAIRSR